MFSGILPPMSPVETETSKALRDLMRRVGASVPASEFIDAVIEAFRVVEPVPDAVIYARFRRTRAWHDFCELLRQAALPAGARILCIGCGPALAGRSAVYASAVVREVYPSAHPDLFDIDCKPWNFESGRFDCVVSHSLLHYAYDPLPICESIYRLVATGGVYIMANEPNASFWSNPECMRELRRVDSAESWRRRWHRYTDPSRYLSKLVRTMRLTAPPDTVSGINRLLRQRFGLQESLTAKEIARIVDPYKGDTNPGEFAHGADGLDWTDLAAGFMLEGVRTSGYVMRDNPARVPERWREVDNRLASLFPLDGCSFSALWRK
jgi:SAM-dependent methyltransferase